MRSFRSSCPRCSHVDIESLEALFASDVADYYCCRECGHLWMLRKGEDSPAIALVPDPYAAFTESRVVARRPG